MSDRAGRRDLWTERADGTGSAELVLDEESRRSLAPLLQGFYSPDGAWLVYREGGAAAGPGGIFGIPLATDSVPLPLVVTEFSVRSPTLSPDGRWLAYISNESGQYDVYVRPFPDVDSGRLLVSTDGGSEPVWAHNGRELFYRNGADELVAVQVSAGSSFAWDRQDVLFSMSDYLPGDGHSMYDVSPDDQRFVMLRLGDTAPASELIMVTNFFEELTRLVPN